MSITCAVPPRIEAGSRELRRLNLAMLAAGLSAFALLYATQALLPEIGVEFGVGATTASLTVSVTTGVLALTVLPMSAMAERLGRTRVMTAGLAVAAVSVVAGAAAPGFGSFLALRALDGLALAAVVAVAVGHIGDEVETGASGAAIGVYVSGTTVGGLLGRLVPAGVSEVASYRWSMAALGLVGAVGAAVFTLLAAPARHRPSPDGGRAAIGRQLADPGIRRLCGAAVLLMGGFVGTYNFLTFRLGRAPFDWSPAVVGLVFLAYLAGTVTSTVAARRAARHGPRAVVLAGAVLATAGLALTVPDTPLTVLPGLVVFTAGFFAAHSVASGWAATRAVDHRSQAAALYLMAYYVGSCVGGTALGLAWSAGGWPATVLVVGCCYLAAAVLVTDVPGGRRDQRV